MHLTPRSAALGVALLLPFPAGAQPVNNETAQTLQQQLQSFLSGLAPGVAGDLHPEVKAEDSHYRVTVPIPGVPGAAATSQAWPLDAGRWRLADIRLPSPLNFTLDLPQAEGAGGSTSFAVRIGAQDSSAEFDPELRGTSRAVIALQNLDLRTDNAQQHQEQQIDSYRASAELIPGADGRLDLASEATLTGWRSASRVEDKPAVAFGADRLHAKGRIAGVDRTQAAAVMSALSDLMAALPTKGAEPGKTPLDPKALDALHTLVRALSGAFTSLDAEETLDGFKIDVAGFGGALIRHLRFGLGGEAPQGLLHAWLDIGMDGLSVSDVPPQTAGLVPHHVTLRPSVRGVPVDALMKLASDATEPGSDSATLAMEAMGLLAQGGITLAIDALAFDLGPADVKGSGQVLISAPMSYQAKAHVTATGLDALIDRARTDPALQKSIPELVMLRGFAQPEGDHLVWNVVAQDGSVTVNGLELMKPPPAEKPPAKPQPRRR